MEANLSSYVRHICHQKSKIAGGLLLLADHVVSTAWPVRALQRMLEIVTIPFGEEHFRRRPIHHVRAAGLVIEQHDRFKLGIVERLSARKPQQ